MTARRLTLAALAAVAVLAPAQAASAQVLEPILRCPPTCVTLAPPVRDAIEDLFSPGTNPPITQVLLDETIGPQRTPRTEDAEVKRSAVVAYGTGTTTCTLTALKRHRVGTQNTWDFEGTTDCSAAVLQTGQASLTGAGTYAAPLCSGVRSACRSADEASGAYTAVGYRVTIVAPPGQGWVASPQECSGAGTDRLECTL